MKVISSTEKHQGNQGGPKSTTVGAVQYLGPLIIGVVVCGLSFSFDEAVLQWVKTHDWKPLKIVAGSVSHWGDWPELMLFGCLGFCLAWLVRSRAICKILLCMMIASSISGLTVNSVRLLAGRARPNNTEAAEEWNGLWRGHEFLLFKNKYHSFPSAHTGAAFAFFGVPLFVHRQYGWLPLFAAIAIGLSRIYLNVHYLSDVVAGVLVGLFTGFLVWERLEARVDRFLERFFIRPV